MIKFDNYRYIFPPRPENTIPSNGLDYWDNGRMIAQPKLNGSNLTIYTNGEVVFTMNRHNQRITNFQLGVDEIRDNLNPTRGKWFAFNGEYMNKSKQDENRRIFNHKFVIFDCLVIEGDYLTGTTFLERVESLNNIFGTNDCEKDYLYGISDNIYRVKSYTENFKGVYDQLTPIDMIEGLVIKQKNGRLETGYNEKNNTRTQLKCRKPTKNYRY